VKKESTALHLKTKDTIEKLTDEEALVLLNIKWVNPIVDAMSE
jgi:type I restriction enzyme M protein